MQHLLGSTEALLRRGLRGLRMCGSACMSLTSVARGHSSCYFECGPHAWDLCAGAVLVREAGGVVMDMRGQPLDLCSRNYLAAANTAVAQEVLACIALPLPM